MCTITSTEPHRTEPYVVLALLTSKLASSLFTEAMSARAICDPKDRAYQAWWDLRRIADTFLQRSSVELSTEERKSLFSALRIAHGNAHSEANYPDFPHCCCFTATMVRGVVEMLASAAAEAVKG